MYIKSILSAILLATLGASPASAVATGWAMAETCGDNMNTAEDCYAKCKTLAEGGAWNANVKLGFNGELTECKCVIHSPNAAPGLPTENIWTCTREPQKPEPKKVCHMYFIFVIVSARFFVSVLIFPFYFYFYFHFK